MVSWLVGEIRVPSTYRTACMWWWWWWWSGLLRGYEVCYLFPISFNNRKIAVREREKAKDASRLNLPPPVERFTTARVRGLQSFDEGRGCAPMASDVKT